jgi:hypothetical protein
MTKLLKYLISECPSYEVRVLFAILTKGESPREISLATSIALPNVYRAINVLKSKGIKDALSMAEQLSLEIKIISGDNEKKIGQHPERRENTGISSDPLSVEIMKKKTPAKKLSVEIMPGAAAQIKDGSPITITTESNSIESSNVKKKKREEKNKNQREKNKNSSLSTQRLRAALPGKIETKYIKPTQEEAESFFESLGRSAAEGKEFWLFWESLNWKSGNTPIAYWRMRAKLRIAQLQGIKGFNAAMSLKPREAWQLHQDDKIVQALIDERQQLINKYQLPSELSSLAPKMSRVRSIQLRLDSLGVQYGGKI